MLGLLHVGIQLNLLIIFCSPTIGRAARGLLQLFIGLS
ncbi:hypothetical protein Gorai_004219 [Gossypium raimondii]|uniref:Uncharacterized protein n=1 Tax=Gossypium raimondii TaxID=29730 RepID=A0A7J8QHK4_GOSRA|nr:hypothetical protein [Gossypium raimondii]